MRCSKRAEAALPTGRRHCRRGGGGDAARQLAAGATTARRRGPRRAGGAPAFPAPGRRRGAGGRPRRGNSGAGADARPEGLTAGGTAATPASARPRAARLTWRGKPAEAARLPPRARTRRSQALRPGNGYTSLCSVSPENGQGSTKLPRRWSEPPWIAAPHCGAGSDQRKEGPTGRCRRSDDYADDPSRGLCLRTPVVGNQGSAVDAASVAKQQADDGRTRPWTEKSCRVIESRSSPN